ncbi:hypothetical protein AcW1_009485 [Taiwanofungus camphoratus]|nr:hypothetical protein AcV7_006922 [Antrodia cinnamomea]KAI0947823.1 hypothetical protein AcW1_009485 [Antrodia cinnamomea]
MDVDDVHEEPVELIALFDLTPEKFPWRPPRPQEIEKRRVMMSDVLIFDILLSSGGIRHPNSLYPPRDESSLQRLLDAIEDSTYDVLKQDSLIYFLLKWHQDGREEGFKEQRGIPPQFVALSDAYWHLDTGIDVQRAVSLLSDARLNRDYTSKIMQAISLTDNSNPLIRRYIRTAKPLLTEPDDIDAYTIALADGSLMEAWQYQRTYSEMSDMRERLIRKILDWCFAPKPRVLPLKQLLALPLSSYEQSLLHMYAVDPPSHIPLSSVAAIQDLVCLRLIQGGQYAVAIKMDHQFAARSRPGDRSSKAALERKQMMDDIMTTMPEAERRLLEVELEHLAQGKGSLSLSASGSGQSRSSKVGNISDLGTSLESVRTPPMVNGPASSAAANRVPAPFVEAQIPAIPQRSGAPRFGGPAPNSVTEVPIPRRNVPRAQALVPASNTTIPTSALFSKSAGGTALAGPSRFQTSLANHSMQSGPSTLSNNSRTGSLFDVTGSANQVPNAFYKPPATAGVKRAWGQEIPRESVNSRHPVPEKIMSPTSLSSGITDDDVNMHSDEELRENGHAETSRTDQSQTDESGVSAEFSISVFSPPAENISKPHPARLRTETKMPPGAFFPESDGENETQRPSRASRREQPSVQPQRSPSPPHPQTRALRTLKAVKERDFGRSLPGSLMDEDEEEDEDVVAPLPPAPPVRRIARKSRSTRGGGQDDMQNVEPVRPRRSTRLSTVSSVGSSSPEPASPQKPSAKSRSARKSTAAAPKGSTRRKR